MANSIVIGYLLKVKYEFAKLTFQLGTCYNSKIIKLSWQTQQDATHRLHPWTDFMSNVHPLYYVEILINNMSRAKIFDTTIMPNISETFFWGFTHFFLHTKSSSGYK